MRAILFASWFCLMAALTAAGDIKTWNGTTGPWSDGGRWTNGLPAAGDEVVINSGSVLLDDATPELLAFTMNGGTLTFTNWSTRLSATTVNLENKSVVTLSAAFTNTVMSNRVWISCATLTMATGAVINADAKGYKGGTTVISPTTACNGHGPGGGVDRGGSASYGGVGGGQVGHVIRPVYGDVAAPTGPGSGGSGDAWGVGGNGGGAVRIQATGLVTVNGTITAVGGNGNSRSAGGSGGSIYIDCLRIEGIGLISAAGGYSDSLDYGNGSGGGRIAVIYDTAAQAAVPIPELRFWAQGGTVIYPGESGTLYFPDNRFLETDVIAHRGQWVTPGLTAYAWDRLTLRNGWLHFPQTGFVMTVTNDLVIEGNNAIASQIKRPFRNNGRLELTNGVLHVGGALVLTNTATLVMQGGVTPPEIVVGGEAWVGATSQVVMLAAPTGGAPLEAGATLTVTGGLTLASGSWLYPVSHWTNGGSVFLRVGALTVESACGINADGRGYGNAFVTYSDISYGPGRGGYSLGGGGYGGKGGTTLGGKAYGDHTHPAEAGSAGGDQAANGGYGGGLIHIESEGGVVVNGTLTADGLEGGSNSGRRGGGGAGGGIYIDCSWIAGTGGVMRANGGLGHDSIYASGGGGGGRIAVIYDPAQQDGIPLPTIQFSALGGRGTGTTFLNNDTVDGEPGTLYFPDSRFLTEPINHSGVWLAPGLADWSVSSMLVSNRWIRFPAAHYKVTVAGDLRIADNGRLDLSNGVLTVGGSVMMTNRGTLSLYPAASVLTGPVMRVAGDMELQQRSYLNVYAAATNLTDAFGAEVSVAGTMSLATNCWVWPFSSTRDGGSACFFVGGLDVETGSAGFHAGGRGCVGGNPTVNPGYGIGRGTVGSVKGGGGHGGPGGIPGSGGGVAYGSETNPVHAGSGGAGTSSGGSYGGAGGGLIWLQSANRVRINGTLNAEGQAADSAGGTYGGGGSGGGIQLRCLRLSGTGVLTARGGNGGSHATAGGGSGGGGRIALWRGLDESAFTINVASGTAVNIARNGLPGTFFTGSVRIPNIGTLIQIR